MAVEIQLANNRMVVSPRLKSRERWPLTQLVLSEFQALTRVKDKKCFCKKYADVCTVVQNIDKWAAQKPLWLA